MALGDAYATAAVYKDRNESTATTDDVELDEMLELNSRRLDRMLQVHDGYFNTHTGTYLFDSSGGEVLRLRDREGMGYCLTAITADSLKLDTDRDGSYDDYTLDLADAWVRGMPQNAAAFSRPFTSIELLPISTATITRWPIGAATVEITGTFGWATVPPAIREVTIALTRDMRDTHLAGSTAELRGPDGETFLVQQDTFGRFMAVARLYGRILPKHAAV